MKQKYEKLLQKRTTLQDEVEDLEKQFLDIQQISSIVDLCLKEIYENEAPVLQSNLDVVQSNSTVLQQKSNEYFSRILEAKNKIKANFGDFEMYTISKLKSMQSQTDQLQKRVDMLKKGLNNSYGDLPPV